MTYFYKLIYGIFLWINLCINKVYYSPVMTDKFLKYSQCVSDGVSLAIAKFDLCGLISSVIINHAKMRPNCIKLRHMLKFILQHQFKNAIGSLWQRKHRSIMPTICVLTTNYTGPPTKPIKGQSRVVICGAATRIYRCNDSLKYARNEIGLWATQMGWRLVSIIVHNDPYLWQIKFPYTPALISSLKFNQIL